MASSRRRAILLVGAEANRPLTIPFAASVLKAAGGRLREVRINRLVGKTYFAEALVDGEKEAKTVDARPSDAIAFAMEVGAPIRVAAHSSGGVVQQSSPHVRRYLGICAQAAVAGGTFLHVAYKTRDGGNSMGTVRVSP